MGKRFIVALLLSLLLGLSIPVGAQNYANDTDDEVVQLIEQQQKPTSSAATASGRGYPFSVSYDSSVWQILEGPQGSSVEYEFTKHTGVAKIFIEFLPLRIHYHEVTGLLVAGLYAAGMTNLEVHEAKLLENNDTLYIAVIFTGTAGGDVELMGYVYHYLTQDGMLRITFLTEISEFNDHEKDFDIFFKGIKVH
ncbi:hypothetical protein SCG7086_BG_00080 [Chlamydiales bacterium SCGC AG-110-P3]|nr:hypothetical protein SCG7086_BG_00080 [Chlamydiales bacterium SCGC AG-110-P3]